MAKTNKKELEQITKIVKGILENFPATRDDDYLLYGHYMNTKGISMDSSFRGISKLVKIGELSSIESVGRARRKLQEKYPELKPSEAAKAGKDKLEEEYKAYSKIDNI